MTFRLKEEEKFYAPENLPEDVDKNDIDHISNMLKDLES